MKREEVFKFLTLRTIGYFLVLFAIYGVFATFGPVLYYQAEYEIMQTRGIHFVIKDVGAGKTSDTGGGLGNLLAGPQQQILIPKDPMFSILIPKIGANAKVIPNVDPSNPEDYLPKLQLGVAHAAGSVFPGMNGNIYLFAHSTDNFWDVGRYNAIFYLLKDLKKDDDVVIFYQNIRHNYKVTKTEITDPSDVSYIIHAQTGKELLILQTCWPPGTTWQRLLVFAEPK